MLGQHLPSILDAAKPDLVFYLGGIDVMAGDRFGRLSLSESGLQRRDAYVIEQVLMREIPLTLLLSGGYAASPERTAHLHASSYREAKKLWRPTPAMSRVENASHRLS